MEQTKIYSTSDIEGMQKSCALAKLTLDHVAQYVEIGVTTDELNTVAHNFMISNGAIPAPLNYKGFPKSICTSVNHVVCHGIPGGYKLKRGDIINIDVTVILDGWYGDTSKTYIVGGPLTRLAEKLVNVAKDALEIGINSVKIGGHFGDIGYAIQTFVESNGFSVVRDFCGHGIGHEFHEPPAVLHFGKQGTGEVILPGMFFTIEPMVNAGSHKTKVLSDGWTAVTIDKSLSAQFEHTIAVSNDKIFILTA